MQETNNVKTFVGIDAHSRQCSIKAIGVQGEKILEQEVPTQARRLSQALKGLAQPACVIIESSAIAPFVKECIEGVVDRVIVCETRENRWISRSEDKSDQADADRLARLLRMGEYKDVHVPKGLSRDRREVLRLYQKAQGDSSRTKNRIKSKYREHGVAAEGKGVYTKKGRDKYLEKIRRPNVRFLFEVLYKKLDADRAAHDALLRRLVSMMKGTREHRLLKTIPGIGNINSAIIVCVIDDPFRFDKKRNLWRYSGLGLRSRWSGDPSRAHVKGTSGGNRLLKYAALNAANASVRGKNRFSSHYKKMLRDGVDPAMAKRTVARQILAVALAMLKSGQAFHEAS
jgi:transposase